MTKHRLLLITLFLTVIAFSCDNFDLNLQEDPNRPAQSAASVDELYNAIQLNFAFIHAGLENEVGQITRMYNATDDTYGAATQPNTMDSVWIVAYAGLFPDVALLEELVTPAGVNNIHIGSAKILQAFVLMELVDVFGDVPFSETNQGNAKLGPKLDKGVDVYLAANGLLDEAIALLKNPGTTKPAFDNFYKGDPERWITLANTIKLRATFLTGQDALFNAIIQAGDFIDEEKEDFQVHLGKNRLNPDSRHPKYVGHYEEGDGDYLSNYYMWLLRAEKLDVAGAEVRDPRLRYYFKRKVSNSDKQVESSYGCVLSGKPDQTKKPPSWNAVDPRLPYCYASTDGYIGRDHLNGSGLPPDGFIKTSYGLYPAGGAFDDNTFEKTQKGGTTGALGQGIFPIILSSFVDFMRAEVAVRTGSGDARALLLSGVGKSLKKVQGFESLISAKLSSTITAFGVTKTVREAFAMTEKDIADYGMLVGKLYDDAASGPGRLDVIIKEYYIAAFGNGLEAYNNYRRTGMPLNMEPALQTGPGNFPRSMRYASVFVDRNINVVQKKESDLIFWDPGTSKVY